MRRAATSLALGALALAAPASAQAAGAYYLGKTSCGDPRPDCIEQHEDVLFQTAPKRRFHMQTKVSCNYTGRSWGMSATLELHGKVLRDGRLVVRRDDYGGTRLRARFANGRLRGKLSFIERTETLDNRDREIRLTCRVRGLRLSARRMGRSLYAPGPYEGHTCEPPEDEERCGDSPPRYPVSFSARAGALEDFVVRLRCTAPAAEEDIYADDTPGIIAVREIRIASVPVDWNGTIDVRRQGLELEGFIVGRQLRLRADYYGEAIGVYDDKCRATFTIEAAAAS